VHHEKYGKGTIQRIMNLDGRLILNILFDGAGKRLLDPNLSPLTRL
jgi:hypothetical protein